MNLLQAIIMGIVQGLTEFIPISSSGHLIIASRLVGLFEGDAMRAQETTATIAVLQLGTLIAVLIYFVKDIVNITIGFARDNIALITGKRKEVLTGNHPFGFSQDAWLGWLVILGSIPIGLVGLILKKQIEGAFTKNLWVIATMMVVIALVLIVAEAVSAKRKSIEELGIGDALAVGFAQVLSLIPGTSRSGSTIMAGLFAGQTRETAARFSFLLSIPAIAASGLLEMKEAIGVLPKETLVPLIVGTIVSGVVGYASIWFLLKYLRTRSLGIFIGYRLIVGVAILVLLYLGVIAPQG